MKPHKACSVLSPLRGAITLMLVVRVTHATTVWTGPIFTYTQPGSDPTQAANQDRLTDNVWLTRASTSGLFNAVNESSYDQGIDQDPSDTEWAVGSLDDYASLTYGTWAAAGGGHPVFNLVGQPLVLHLITDDIYLSVQFTQLGGHGAGGFAYQRSTPAVISPSPTVGITNPADGAVFSAPANLKISASAAVSAGTVTNVAFFAGNTLLGSAQADPFQITVNALAAGNYSLTAVATAAGISTTSSVVNVSIISPIIVSNTAPAVINGKFSFNYNADMGLTYVVQRSSDLINWSPVSTNVANTSNIRFTDNAPLNSTGFYRVARQPNP